MYADKAKQKWISSGRKDVSTSQIRQVNKRINGY